MSILTPINKRKLELPSAPKKEKRNKTINSSDVLYTSSRRLHFSENINNIFDNLIVSGSIENEEDWSFQKKILTVSNAMETNMNIIINLKNSNEKMCIKPLYFNYINNDLHLIYENLQTNIISEMINWINIKDITYIL
jgi:hypothetical protein